MGKTAKIFFLLIGFMAAHFGSACALGIKFTDEELALASEEVVAGHVTDVQSYRDGTTKLIFTKITIKKESVIKGDSSEEYAQVVLPGGRADGYILTIPGVPVINKGDSAVFFLRKAKSGNFVPVGLKQGRVPLSKKQDGSYTAESKALIGKVKLIIQNQKPDKINGQ